MIPSRPRPSEVEISLLGPGFGECALVHLGSDRWIIIDSCADSASGRPAPLEYLANIGVDPSSVELVIASHWHDDHIRGLAEVLAACTNAKFCCSSAFTKEEFIGLVTKFEPNRTIAGGSGVRELHQIYALLQERGSAIMATADRRLMQIPSNAIEHGCTSEVWTLSPSDQRIADFLMQIGSCVAEVRETRYRIPVTNQNDLSVVIWISIGSEAFLLGADLEENGASGTGWSAIVSSTARPIGQASVFKIPHHGSITGHCEAVWNSMLAAQVFGLISPFNRGRKKLPSIDDIDRICSRTEHAYVTSSPHCRPSRRRDSAVDKTIRETVVRLRTAEPATGHIRLRKQMHPEPKPWTVELDAQACHATEFKGRLT
jgi:hypothetical protein